MPTRKLTLNLGLRWDHIGQLQSATGQRSNYQIDTNTFCIRTGCLRAAELETVPTARGLRVQPG